MSTTARIVRWQLGDLLRSRWLLAYLGFFAAFAEALFRLQGSGLRVLLGLVDVVLLLIPLASLVFGTIYLYGAREFIELLLAQPVRRRQIFAGLYLGLAGSLSAAFALGVAAPFAYHGPGDAAELGALAAVLAAGVALTWVFTALAFLIALRCDDRVRGLAAAVLAWLALAVVYDGALLFGAAAFADHPLETPLLVATAANPIDLSRVLLLLRFDIAALMGYTGQVFARFFGSALGAIVAAGALAAWVAGPVAAGVRAFGRKDF